MSLVSVRKKSVGARRCAGPFSFLGAGLSFLLIWMAIHYIWGDTQHDFFGPQVIPLALVVAFIGLSILLLMSAGSAALAFGRSMQWRSPLWCAGLGCATALFVCLSTVFHQDWWSILDSCLWTILGLALFKPTRSVRPLRVLLWSTLLVTSVLFGAHQVRMDQARQEIELVCRDLDATMFSFESRDISFHSYQRHGGLGTGDAYGTYSFIRSKGERDLTPDYVLEADVIWIEEMKYAVRILGNNTVENRADANAMKERLESDLRFSVEIVLH